MSVFTVHQLRNLSRDCSYMVSLFKMVAIPSQFGISFFLIIALILQSILWCRGVRDRAFIIACSPIVSFDLLTQYVLPLYCTYSYVCTSAVLVCSEPWHTTALNELWPILIVNWWATTQQLLIFTNRTFQPGGLCQQLTTALVYSWQRPLGQTVLLLNINNSCVFAHQFTTGISQHNYEPLKLCARY